MPRPGRRTPVTRAERAVCGGMSKENVRVQRKRKKGDSRLPSNERRGLGLLLDAEDLDAAGPREMRTEELLLPLVVLALVLAVA